MTVLLVSPPFFFILFSGVYVYILKGRVKKYFKTLVEVPNQNLINNLPEESNESESSSIASTYISCIPARELAGLE